MKKNKHINNAKLGLFVLAGVLFLIMTLYMIGRNINMLGANFPLTATVMHVDGLVAGNNVRFKGINVGTVKAIDIANDTAIVVNMLIKRKMKTYIKKNALVSIGTDGLMGDKLINIHPQAEPSEPVREEDILAALKPVETEDMLRTLSHTNHNLEKITDNLYTMSEKLNNNLHLWSLLSDSSLSHDIKTGVKSFKVAGTNTAEMTRAASELMIRLENGKGLANLLFTDTALVHQLSGFLQDIDHTSQETSLMVLDLRNIIDEMEQGKGAAGMLFSDSLLRKSLLQTSFNLEEGTDLFAQNMKALQVNFLFRRYFRKLEKQQKDSLKEERHATPQGLISKD